MFSKTINEANHLSSNQGKGSSLRKAAHASVSLFPLLFHNKRKIAAIAAHKRIFWLGELKAVSEWIQG